MAAVQRPILARLSALLLPAAVSAVLGAGGPALALEPVQDFVDNPGDLRMYLHRPAGIRPGLPLVVALHGCTQSAAGFDDETGLAALAEEVPFVLLLPEQQPRNMARRCFRWYDAGDNRPGQGESASILSMIEAAIESEKVDPGRVFILGLSAGGAMTAVMMANYPDRFAGGAILAGLPYGCNRPVSAFDFFWTWYHHGAAADGADAAYACGIGGIDRTDRDAEEWAGFVLDAAGQAPARWPLVSLWQGAADPTVDPANLRELTEQWTAVQGIDAIADEERAFGSATRERYLDDEGNLRLETWTLGSLGHAVPIDADGEPESCGFEAAHIDDAGLCAVRRIAEFWRLTP
ncbi:PHB depolymerase family esterase [Cereibacter sphaeroides]|uniref:extracellular catalytic domain type 1 short-chain-length polyhydroxyalkanoate depolymerase n=1 Tax=Cereibacter sphaeroides TaxID=1063 RepID=UPI001F18F6E3|nr:PHB depolymerase family esterase [Cereibacter sphaeroides]MCE6959129.1 PHB depolymerase family esterase [Cereibacter sphaeroides]MCE6974210.1 PHB depolymerase family esterase [Cereibacter sphaeroides]